MKLSKLFTIAMILFAAFAANVQTASAQKADRSWVVFTGYQTVQLERSPVAAKYTCQSSIYATANFAAPVDLSGGFYVTIATGGKVIIQEKMTVDGNPGARRSIPVDIIPDDDAELGFPDASLEYSHALLTELKPGVHNITVAVSVGEGADEQIAAGSFSFDNRRGCEERFARVDRLINGTVSGDAETGNTKEEPADEDGDEPIAPSRPQPNKPQTPATTDNGMNYVRFSAEGCDEDQKILYKYPNGTSSIVYITKGFGDHKAYPVGTRFWRGTLETDSPFFTLGKSQFAGDMDKFRAMQEINLCR